MNLRERLLSKPVVYKAFKRVVLPKGNLERIVVEHYRVADGGKVLDLGCGYGDLARHFSPRCSYLGIDHNAQYIERAKVLNSSNGAVFEVADLGDPLVAHAGPFDLVMISGVLHHLTDDVAMKLAEKVKNVLSATGRFVAMEPVFSPEQGLIARLTVAADRGRYARDEAGYRALVSPAFVDLTTSIVHDALRIPYTHIVLSASNRSRP